MCHSRNAIHEHLKGIDPKLLKFSAAKKESLAPLLRASKRLLQRKGRCVCVCVCERERERERECVCVCARARARVCACACACAWSTGTIFGNLGCGFFLRGLFCLHSRSLLTYIAGLF